MFERLTPNWLFICDRCGKEMRVDDRGEDSGVYTVEFSCGFSMARNPGTRKGDVCEDCKKDFLEIAANFFDEVNRRADNEN